MSTSSPIRATARAFSLAAAEGRTPTPLNIVGEETLVKVSPAYSEGHLAVFHLVGPPTTA